MLDKSFLEDMSHIKLKDMAPDRLQDILEVEVKGDTARQRLESFLIQAGNPYCFRVGNTPVRISFKACEKTLDEKIKSYFLGLKN